MSASITGMKRMNIGGIIYREARGDDMPAISRVRFAVRENILTPEQLRARGVTEESMTASFLTTAKGWVAECENEIVGFSIADREEATIFALFVLPEFEGKGIGGRLLDLAVDWLKANGVMRAWLTTGPNTKAARFYARRGWVIAGPGGSYGDDRYEFTLPD
jgi:GNAT superfamily N-acetyltransferase